MKSPSADESYISNGDACVVRRGGLPRCREFQNLQIWPTRFERRDGLPQSITVAKEVHLSVRVDRKDEEGASSVNDGPKCSLLVDPPFRWRFAGHRGVGGEW